MEFWDRHARSAGNVIEPLPEGGKIRLHFDSQLCRLIYAGPFEASERLFATRFLRPGDGFVDVGANIGLFTLIAARRVGASGFVHCFEPSEKTFARLEDNLRLNALSNVNCHRVAVSSSSGKIDLLESAELMDGWNSMAAPYVGGDFRRVPVDCVTWDQFAETHALIGRVALMKIDVEGWESHVLAGGQRTLSREDAPVLQVEFTEEAAKAAGSSCAELYRALASLGYSVMRYDAEKNDLSPEPLREEYGYTNLFAVKSPIEAMARLRSANERS